MPMPSLEIVVEKLRRIPSNGGQRSTSGQRTGVDRVDRGDYELAAASSSELAGPAIQADVTIPVVTQESGPEARGLKRRTSGNGRKGQSAGNAQSAVNGTALTESTEGDRDRQCRVCLGSVGDKSLAEGSAIYLGCSCALGEAPLHYACAEKWFKERPQFRGTVTCEVCKCPAKKLPESLKREIANQKNRRGRMALAEMHDVGGASRQLLPSEEGSACHLRLNNGWCLSLVAALTVLMAMFYDVCMEMSFAWAIVASIVVSCASTVHWVAHPNRPALHLLFVFSFFMSIAGITVILGKIEGWKPSTSCALGALTGGSLSAGVYTLARSASLSLCHAEAEPHMDQARVIPGREETSQTTA